jgi:phage tail sheath protein FI
MPEYLAPGVYVEEVDTGSKPIEGVSTSTAGMVGVTERGPVNVPILVTSYGEYVRWFGERLKAQNFANGDDRHCFLPHAVEGFFTNGGKRVYITRIEANGATRATFDLHDRGDNTSAWTMLLRAAPELTGSSTGPADPPIYVLNTNPALPNTGSLANGDHIRIGGGSDAEYRVVSAAPAPAFHVSLNFPLTRPYDPAITVHNINRVLTAAPNAFPMSEGAEAGTSDIVVTANAGDIAVDNLLEIGSPLAAEHRFVRAVATVGATLRVTLRDPLMLPHPTTTSVLKLNPTPGGADEVSNNTLSKAAHTGDRVVFLTAPIANFDTRSTLIVFNRGNIATRQARRVGRLGMLALATGAPGAYPAGTVVEGITLADDGAVTPKNTTAPITAGVTVITVDNRAGLNPRDVLRIGAANAEYAMISALPNPSPGNAPPNPGNIVLTLPLTQAHPHGTVVQRQQSPTVRPERPTTVVVLDVASGETAVPVTDGGLPNTPLQPANPPPVPTVSQFLNGEFVRVTTATGDVSYHALNADARGLNAQPVTLSVPLARPHAAGTPVAERRRLLTVQALDTGIWGNRLRLSIEDEVPGLVAPTTIATAIGQTRLRLASAAGVEAGTLLEIRDPVTGGLFVFVKVQSIDRSTGELTLDAGAALSAAQFATISSAPPNTFAVLSREFRLTVHLLRQPDPLLPSRNDTVLNTEVFRYLSMDSRHSRYVQKIVGDINGPLRLADRRSEGESWYIRVHDVAQDLPDSTPTLESIRLGPEPLLDTLPDGRRRPARHPLGDVVRGDDFISMLTDNSYIGQDDPNPENRTGLYSLRNIEEISIVACPGRTSTAIQNALITHCELMRYRFAVLYAHRPPNDAMADVQNQRQQFDTKYAALYHPWLLIPDPFPTNLTQVANYPIPPSGHILGIYARTDIERGVHKAPANEVVRGIIGLQRLLNKEQQDIVNPVNINVIRDFRPNNRGIRVFGGRVITSDSDWKYVNVRRLLIFIEDSIDRGLQWVVFEPNAEPLWARVRRSISNFLTLVWRNGALEGTKVEEAYFVKCDRTTMTQTDIDSGRLIVVVGVAPVKPAEFVIIRIGLWTAHADD